ADSALPRAPWPVLRRPGRVAESHIVITSRPRQGGRAHSAFPRFCRVTDATGSRARFLVARERRRKGALGLFCAPDWTKRGVIGTLPLGAKIAAPRRLLRSDRSGNASSPVHIHGDRRVELYSLDGLEAKSDKEAMMRREVMMCASRS